MKDMLIYDFNKYQRLYCEYTYSGKIEDAFNCVDMAWWIWGILEKKYGMKREDMTEKKHINLSYYII